MSVDIDIPDNGQLRRATARPCESNLCLQYRNSVEVLKMADVPSMQVPVEERVNLRGQFRKVLLITYDRPMVASRLDNLKAPREQLAPAICNVDLGQDLFIGKFCPKQNAGSVDWLGFVGRSGNSAQAVYHRKVQRLTGAIDKARGQVTFPCT